MSKKFLLLSAMAAGLGVAGCSGPRLVDTGAVAVVEAGALPPPAQQDLVSDRRAHLIGPFDRLAVEVFALPELSRQVQVDASGNLALPLAGVIEANGKSPVELAEMVEQRLREGYVRDPQVTVNVLETVSQLFTVDGEVRAPGLYPAIGKMSLMRAVARAQGTNEFAETKHVVVFRTVDGKRMAALYDLRAIRLGAYVDPEIFPNDVVVVGEDSASRVFPQVLQASSFFLTPLLTVLN